ncbi:MarR family winged helix-turn-helix transcriptional regulator [Chitinophagaceae bacterium MMS25-I14]
MKIEDVLKTNKFANERHKAILNMMYTAYWIKSNFSKTLKDYGLTEEQFNVMRILKGKYPERMCVRDIGSRMIERSSNVPRIIDRLVAKKLAERMPSTEDKRETLTQLTEKGITLLEEASKLVRKLQDEFIDLTEEDAVLINTILDNMRKD